MHFGFPTTRKLMISQGHLLRPTFCCALNTKMSSKQALQNRRSVLWWGVLCFAVMLVVFLFYTPTTERFDFTYLKPPASPGTLYSERWSRDYFFVGSLVLLWLVPLSAAFMSDSPCKRGRQLLHIGILIVMWMYLMVVMGMWSFDYATANQATVANQFNRANDDRWCCVHYTLSGSTACPNTAACAGVSAADFVVNPAFLWRFWWLIIYICFIMIDFFFTLVWFQPAVIAYIDELNGDETAGAKQVRSRIRR